MSRSPSIVLNALLAAFVSASAFADASYPETIRLVRSMREDELLMDAVHAKSAQQLKKNKADKRAACLVNAKYPYLTDAIAWVISSQLTDAEVTEAIAFYRSRSDKNTSHRDFNRAALLRSRLKKMPRSRSSRVAPLGASC